MSIDYDQPIVARATPPGEGAIAIVRLSGSGVILIADRLFSPSSGETLSTNPERTMVYGTLHDDEMILDRPLAVYFAAPRSFTGEDMVEFHVHGNPLVVDRLTALCVDSGCRLAEPGEFSRRAFMNGKMDLAQAEGLAEVIRAESEAALDLAHRQLGGELALRFSAFRKKLVEFLALLELELDFVQEGYELLDYDDLDATLSALRLEIDGLLSSFRTGDRLRRGPRILLLGPPNAGKSSLFNAILGYSRSLVSERPGTTRDYIEERILHHGVVLHFLDTAGIRKTPDSLEAAGVARANELLPFTDHVLYLIDSTREDGEILQELDHCSSLDRSTPDVEFRPVLTKVDIGSRLDGILSTSVQDRSSIEELLSVLVSEYSIHRSAQLLLLTQRQHLLLASMQKHLESMQISEDLPTEFLSADLRTLLLPLSELTGAVTNEDILDAVFSGFCIGK